MRKGFDGLSAVVEQQLGGQLLKGDVFLFVGRCRQRAKVLYFDEWALAQRALPGSALRKALEYMLELWSGLTVFLSNAWVPLDNNLVERQLRDMVLGRKNHYGSKSLRGTEVAALFYSLMETARLCGEDPGATCCAPRSPPSPIPAPSRSLPASTEHAVSSCSRPGRAHPRPSRRGTASCYLPSPYGSVWPTHRLLCCTYPPPRVDMSARCRCAEQTRRQRLQPGWGNWGTGAGAGEGSLAA
ncbi:transposase [Cystobacter fuscus]|nr:transposase [Cystobacter fuscus]